MLKSILRVNDFLKLFLEKHLKLKYLTIILLNVLSSILELVSIWLLVPLISTLLNGSNNFFTDILNFFGLSPMHGKTTIVVLGAYLVISAFAITFRLIISKKKLNFVYNHVYNYIIEDLMKYFLATSYAQKRKVKYSDLVSIFSSKIEILCTKFFLSSINFYTNLIYLISLIILAIFLSPKEVLYSSFIILIYFLFTILIRPYLVKQGNFINKGITKLVKLVNDAHNNFVEIKIYGLETQMISKLNYVVKNYTKSITNNTFYAELPRQLLEFLLIFAVVIFFFYNGSNTSLLMLNMPKLVALGMIIQKILPVIQIVYSSLSSMISNEAMLDEFKSLKLTLKANFMVELSNQNTLDFKSLALETPKILIGTNFISLDLKYLIMPGEKISIIGKSGSGKSSLILALMGLIDSEGIFWNFKSTNFHQSPPLNMFGYSGQKPIIFDGSIFENVTLKSEENISIQDRIKVYKIFEGLLIEYIITNVDNNLIQNRSLVDLSGGELQRISLARLIFQSKDINFIDEGTSALDSKTESIIIEYILNELKDKTIFFVTHSNQINNYMSKTIKVKSI